MRVRGGKPPSPCSNPINVGDIVMSPAPNPAGIEVSWTWTGDDPLQWRVKVQDPDRSFVSVVTVPGDEGDSQVDIASFDDDDLVTIELLYQDSCGEWVQAAFFQGTLE
jgi:hypothetical protein